MKKTTLYITYDGLTDPLGKSQIIPYLISISEHPRKLIVLSFEKQNKFSDIQLINKKLVSKNIKWINLNFSHRLKIFSKLIDLFKFFFYAIYLTKKYKIKIIHGRGTLPTLFGYIVKKFYNIKLIFDCRGMWVDERVDNKQWNLNNKFYKISYYVFKRIEDLLFTNSDSIIVLSNTIIPYLIDKYNIKNKLTVIPCCVDYELFKNNYNHDKISFLKNEFQIENAQYIFCYSGSLGGIYKLKEMLNFFYFVQKNIKNVFFVFFTQNIEILKKELNKKQHLSIKNYIRCKNLDRDDLPKYISICDALIYFIEPTFAKKASCPTKLGESLSLGIPIITNKGIGDIDYLFKKIKPGFLFDKIDDENFQYFINNINLIKEIKGGEIRKKSKNFFDINKAINLYQTVYSGLEKDTFIAN
tara:strand:- start:5222 stop:6460 length:1239 start_codon:yes stop_codon:yes gene_type:complete